jgi:putative restriction endonuclease
LKAGDLLVAKSITPSDQQKMGLVAGMCLRWVSVQHGPYLDFHRQRFLQLTAE